MAVVKEAYAACWWCGNPNEMELLHRLDSFTFIGGFQPFVPPGRTSRLRICQDCALLFARMRIFREMELLQLS